MAESSGRQHAGTGSDAVRAPEPTYAERVRTLTHSVKVGSLCSLSQKLPGWPFGSVMPYAMDETGRPSFLISSMAMHTQNLVGDSRSSLLIIDSAAADDPLGAARVTLLGRTNRVPANEAQSVRGLYLARHANAGYWVDFNDFAFYRMDVIDLYYVGGFGVMGWVTADEYAKAAVDPLADTAAGIIQHMNTDHADSLVLLARDFGEREVEEAVMTSVDRLGFQVRLRTGTRAHSARIPFSREVRNAQDTRMVLVEMVQRARRGL